MRRAEGVAAIGRIIDMNSVLDAACGAAYYSGRGLHIIKG